MGQLLLLVLLGLSSITLANESARIINGTRVAPNQADFYVALLDPYSWATGTHYSPMCGGTHIGQGQVITAAHCLSGMSSQDTYYASFGDTSDNMHMEYCTKKGVTPYNCTTDRNGIPDLTKYQATNYSTFTGDPTQLYAFTVANVRVHKNYNPRNFKNDIALIQFNQLFNYPEAQLPSVDGFAISANLKERGTATVIGFGDTLSDGDSETFILSDNLLFSELNANDTRFCQSQWGNLFDPVTMICASSDEGKDTCQGDSGGPLVLTGSNVIYGITSFGSVKCGDSSGVYARVFNYIDWINDARAATGLGPGNSGGPVDQPTPEDNPNTDTGDSNSDTNDTPEVSDGTEPTEGVNTPFAVVPSANANTPTFRSAGALNISALLVFGLLFFQRKTWKSNNENFVIKVV